MSTDDSDQVVQRRANLQELKDLGVDPYPRRFEGGIPIAPLVAEHGHKTAQELEGTRITIRTAGRILAIRGFGKAGFLQLSEHCLPEIATGAENGSEMGAFNRALDPIKRADLRAKVQEYAPIQARVQFRFVT